MAPRSHFPSPTRDEPLVNLNARISRDLLRRVKLQCIQADRLLRDFITEALRARLSARRRR